MIEEIAVILVIFTVAAVGVISRSMTVMGLAVFAITTIMVLYPQWFVIAFGILAMFMMGMVLLYGRGERW